MGAGGPAPQAAGIGTHFEVSQAEAPLPETHRQLDALDEEIALTRNQLAALFPGLPPHRLHRFACGHVVGPER